MIVLLVLIISGIYINNSFSSGSSLLTISVFTVTHFAGALMSFILMMHELNFRTKISDVLCKISDNFDCEAVSRSNTSRIFGEVTWADAGVAYFIGGLLILFVLPANESLNLVALLSISVLPLIVFSILYQWLRIGKWCLFCLIVQVILVVEAVILFNFIDLSGLQTSAIINVIIIFSVVFIVLILLKLNKISDVEKEHYKLETIRMKRDPDFLIPKLLKGERIEIPDCEHTLVFGNIGSKSTISVFLGFYCSACARKFESIYKLAKNYRDVKIQFVFPLTKGDISMFLYAAIYKLSKAGNETEALEELHKWYDTEKKNRYKLSVIKESINGFPSVSEDTIQQNSFLFEDGTVSLVPSIYVNGYPLPDSCSIEDIKYQIYEIEKWL